MKAGYKDSKISVARHVRPSAHRRSGQLVNLAANLLLIAAGTLGAWNVLAPQDVERSYGTLKTTTNEVISTARERLTGQIPTVHLGAAGGVSELDECDGTFTEMLSYEHADVPTVWAAHNNCGGDVLLPWDTGEQIRIAGSDQVYEVVDVRHTSKIWATTDDLVGLDGDLALQTCQYGQDRMKFIGLRPVTAP